MIKILHIISSLEYGGGVQMMLKNYFEYIDHEKYSFDFIVHGSKVGELESFFQSYGSNIYHIIPRKKNLIKNLFQIKSIIKNGRYDIVHNHQDYHGAYSLDIAKKYGVSGRISHTHITQEPASCLNKIIKKMSVNSLKKSATDFFACSEDALKCMFGGYALPDDYKIINNAIDFSKYEFSQEKRDFLRAQFGIRDEFVIGHIGRFVAVKNHSFILDMFSAFQTDNPDSVLLLVGDGPLLDEMKAKAVSLGIENKVIFSGVRKDVPAIISAMDVLVLPSFSEGLGMAAIEAQAGGISCICSDGVPKKVNITGQARFVSTQNTDNWRIEIKKAKETSRFIHTDKLKVSGFDLKEESDKLMNYYKLIAKRD